MRGDYYDVEELSETARAAFEFFTGPDYNFKDLVLPRMSK
jgi:hypothetical protein